MQAMTWKLSGSRHVFFSQTGVPRHESFWSWYEPIADERRSCRGEVSAYLTSWDPQASDARSNCPELHRTLERLIAHVDSQWRARAAAIYAGRTVDHDDSAMMYAEGNRGGMIALSAWYANAMFLVTSAYGQFVLRMSAAGDHLDVGDERGDEALVRALDSLWEALDGYREGGAIKSDYVDAMRRERELFRFNHGSVEANAHHIAAAAEEFVVAHELSHHILRDRGRRLNRDVVDEIEQQLAAPVFTAERRRVAPSQHEEVLSDVLAFELATSGRPGLTADDAQDVALTLTGAVIALATLGYLRDEWVADPEDDHPGALDRIAVLVKHVSLKYGDVQFGSDETATIARLAGTVAHFVQLMFNHANTVASPSYTLAAYGVSHQRTLLTGIAPDDTFEVFWTTEAAGT